MLVSFLIGESKGETLSNPREPFDPIELEPPISFSVIMVVGAPGPNVTRSGYYTSDESLVSAEVKLVFGVYEYFFCILFFLSWALGVCMLRS